MCFVKFYFAFSLHIQLLSFIHLFYGKILFVHILTAAVLEHAPRQPPQNGDNPTQTMIFYLQPQQASVHLIVLIFLHFQLGLVRHVLRRSLDMAASQVSKRARTCHLAELRNDDTIQMTTRRPPVWRERPLASLSSALPNCASQRHELLFVPRVDHHVPSGQPQTPLSALPLGRMSAGSGAFLGQDGSALSQVYYRRCYRTLSRHCAMMRWPPVVLHFSVLLLHQLASYCCKRWLGHGVSLSGAEFSTRLTPPAHTL